MLNFFQTDQWTGTLLSADLGLHRRVGIFWWCVPWFVVWVGNPLVGVLSCMDIGKSIPVTTNHVDLLHIHRQSAYLVGQDKAVVDIPLDHPLCSKQHAVVQRVWSTSVQLFTSLTWLSSDRSVPEKDELRNVKAKIKWVQWILFLRVTSCPLRPFIIDLESTNGTHVNDEAIPTLRYYKLRTSDSLFTFGTLSGFNRSCSWFCSDQIWRLSTRIHALARWCLLTALNV